MSKKPPNRPGITFEVGARVEAQDYLQKWYPSHIEKIDYEEGKMLVHFDRWSHRYDEWIFWDSNRLRPLDKSALRKESLREGIEMSDRTGEMRASRHHELPGCTESSEDQTELLQSRQVLKSGEEVLARWTDCRYYPAKIESINTEGTYTVQFYDGVIRCVKRVHIKSMPEDAKGQDWIALVRAATAAARNKPRTSANSNKDGEERHDGGWDQEEHTDEGWDQEEHAGPADQEEADSDEKSVTLVPIMAEQPETVRAKREKRKRGTPLHPKGVRFNKSTGLSVSKVPSEYKSADKEEEGEGNVSGTSEENSLQGPSGGAEEVAVPARLAPSTSPTMSRSRRLKHHSGESTSRQGPPSLSFPATPTVVETPPKTESAISPVTGHSLHHITQNASPGQPRNPAQGLRRRRSQRLATCELPGAAQPVSAPGLPGAPDSTPLLEKDEPHLNPCVDVPVIPAPPTAASPLALQPPIAEANKQTDSTSSNKAAAGGNVPPPTAGASPKAAARTLKPNKHAREPIMNTIKSDDPTSMNEALFDLDHNKFRCRMPGCTKAFRKAKLLDYHLKYYHNVDQEVRAEGEVGSPDRAGRTRATSASVPGCTPPEAPDSKRRRTVSTSATLSPQRHAYQLDCYSTELKPPKMGKKKRSSTSVSPDAGPPPPQDKAIESLHDKILKKVIEKDKYPNPGLLKPEKKIRLEEKGQEIGKKKEKEKERKEKDPFKLKQKKKKKKKKKSKQHSYSDFDDLPLAFLERCPSPVARPPRSPFTFHGSASSRHTTFQYPRAILSVDLSGENLSDIDFLEDSSTESLLLSGDEYNQDLDSLTMDDFQEEEDDGSEIVRCVCEMDEENGFMIQCEDCMCWQHSVCMGLLEDSIPDQYVCYICRDPPGQRWSARYRHDKDWLNKGHMYGLSFLPENYSHQNAKKMVSTHQLLADVCSVKNVLHGLQLKMEILQNRHNPSLHLWARSWVNSDEDQLMAGHPDCLLFQEHLANSLNKYPGPDAYIASEHSYQKPLGLSSDPWPISASCREAASRAADAPAPLAVRFVPDEDEDEEEEEEEEEDEVSAGSRPQWLTNSGSESELMKNRLHWQQNLLAHIEEVQNQVASRMDLIEKELDVLESWLDFTGELEPPDPLARLPQLKRRIKQLLSDLGKVQQMSTLCPV